jgi:hypothetical protein
MQTEVVHEVRKDEYAFAVVYCALPIILIAREIGCTTGEHLAEFLNAVRVPVPNGGFSKAEVAFCGEWTKNSANRAVHYLIKAGKLEWHRHRGKRKPALEAKRKACFHEAVAYAKIKYAMDEED